MAKRGFLAVVALLLLLPATFGGLSVTCRADENGRDISDAFEDLLEAIEDAF